MSLLSPLHTSVSPNVTFCHYDVSTCFLTVTGDQETVNSQHNEASVSSAASLATSWVIKPEGSSQPSNWKSRPARDNKGQTESDSLAVDAQKMLDSIMQTRNVELVASYFYLLLLDTYSKNLCSCCLFTCIFP